MQEGAGAAPPEQNHSKHNLDMYLPTSMSACRVGVSWAFEQTPRRAMLPPKSRRDTHTNRINVSHKNSSQFVQANNTKCFSLCYRNEHTATNNFDDVFIFILFLI